MFTGYLETKDHCGVGRVQRISPRSLQPPTCRPRAALHLTRHRHLSEVLRSHSCEKSSARQRTHLSFRSTSLKTPTNSRNAEPRNHTVSHHSPFLQSLSAKKKLFTHKARNMATIMQRNALFPHENHFSTSLELINLQVPHQEGCFWTKLLRTNSCEWFLKLGKALFL